MNFRCLRYNTIPSSNISSPSLSLLARLLLLTTFSFALLSLPRLSSAEALETQKLTLIESEYTSTIAGISTSQQDKSKGKYTIDKFISGIVLGEEGGVFATDIDDDEEKDGEGKEEQLSSIRYFKSGFTWPSSQQDQLWEPLDITTWEDSLSMPVSGESRATREVVKDSGAIIILWRHSTTSIEDNFGMRITVVANLNSTSSSTSRRKYEHILLIENPKIVKAGGGVEFDTIPSQERSGIVWFGNWLYIGNGQKGLRAFDLSHIWKVKLEDDNEDHDKMGGMKYVLPQARTYDVSNFPDRFANFTFSFLSLDRSNSSTTILTGEYESREGFHTYICRWPFSLSTGQLRTSSSTSKPNSPSLVSATWAWKMYNVLDVRGMMYSSQHKMYFVAREPEPEHPGELLIWTPGQTAVPVRGGSVLPTGVGGLAYSPEEDIMWIVARGSGSSSRGVVGVAVEGYFDSKGEVNTVAPSTTTQAPTVATSSITSSSTSTATNTPTITSPSNSPDTNTTTTTGNSNKPSTGTILGGTFGGLIAVGALLWAVLFFFRRRRQRQTSQDHHNANSYPMNHQDYHQHTYQSASSPTQYGEIPALKTELDGNSIYTGVGTGGAGRAGGSPEEGDREVGSINKGLHVHAKKPKPVYHSRGTRREPEGPWVELPADEGSEKRIEMA